MDFCQSFPTLWRGQGTTPARGERAGAIPVKVVPKAQSIEVSVPAPREEGKEEEGGAAVSRTAFS